MILNLSLAGWRLKRVVRDAIAQFQPVTRTGVAVAVLQAGKTAFAGGFGLRDRERGLKANARTRFAIGSATKAFNSMLLAIHAANSRGAFSLDRPVTSFAPDFDIGGSRVGQITLVDMLSHQAGLPRNDALWYLGPFARDELYFRLRGLEQIDGAFRDKFLYNNLLYMTAGHVLESLIGTSWEQLVQKSILDKLGMTDTSFTSVGFARDGNYAKGYFKAAPIPVKNYGSIGPAAEMNSTVLDLAKWVQMFLAKGLTSDGEVLLDRPAVERQYKELIATGAEGVSYGMGWYIGRLQSLPYVFHDGIADGYSSFVSFMPTRALGVIVLSNEHTPLAGSTLGGYWPLKVAEKVYDWLLNGRVTHNLTLPRLPDGARLFDLPLESESAFAGRSSADTGVVVDYCGIYSDMGYGDMTVGRVGLGLQLSYYGQSWPLKMLGGDVFSFTLHANGTDLTLRCKFLRDGDCKITGFVTRLTSDANVQVVFTRR